MPGYPFAVSQPLEKYTNYDPELAQKLLAEAGFPNGKGFPTVTFSYPASPSALDRTTRDWSCRRCRDNWNQVLFGGNSTLLLQEMDTVDFYTKMEAKPTRRSRWASSPTAWTTSTPPTC